MVDEPRPDDAWIEKVVSIAGALGLSRMRVRWKLIRWQESRRKARRWREQRIEHIRYQHKTCPQCGAIQDRAEASCTVCSTKLPSRQLQVLQRIGLSMPQAFSMSTLLAIAILGVYLRVWIAAGGGLGSAPGSMLQDFGGHAPVLTRAEPWRLVTAIFLHAGLWHLGFNLVAIATIGPRLEELYGRLTMLMLFVVTGALANAGSDAMMGPGGIGIGASGGVMGLVGALAGYGQRWGTTSGRALRNDMLKWAAYTIIFGFVLHADNWAHAFGALAGAVFGYAVRPALWARPRLVGVRVAGKLVGAVAAVGALVIIFTRTPAPLPEAVDPDEVPEEVTAGNAAVLRKLVGVCGTYYGGDPAGGIAQAKALGTAFAGADAVSVERLCVGIYMLRDQCRSAASSAQGAGAASGAGSVAPGEPEEPRDRDAPERRPERRDEQGAQDVCEAAGADLLALPDRPARPAR